MWEIGRVLRQYFQTPMLRCVGLDMGSGAIKLVELEAPQRLAQPWRVHTAYYVENSAPNLQTEWLNHPSAAEILADQIRQVFMDSGAQSRHMVMAMPPQAVTHKILNFPAQLPASAIEVQLRLTLENHVPFPVDEIQFDFQCLGLDDANPDQQRVLLAACRKHDRLAYENLLNMAGLTPAVLEHETFAWQNIAHLPGNELNLIETNEIVGLLDIGANKITLNILENRQIIYQKEQQFGCQILLEAAAQYYQISDKNILNYIREKKLPSDYNHHLLLPFLADLALQVERALQFYYATDHQHKPPKFLFLTGGGTQLYSLEETLEDYLGIECKLLNTMGILQFAPNARINVSEEYYGSFSLALGLAFRASD